MNKRILAVEDSVDSQNLISRAVGLSYELVFADTIKQGFEELTHKTFSLVLLDLVLPDGDGFQLYQKIRATPAGEDLPIIFLTAKNDLPTLSMGFQLGADDYISKPFNPIELMARINARIGKSEKKTKSGSYSIGPIFIDVDHQQIEITAAGKAQKINPTPIEFRLIHQLTKAPGSALTRRNLIDAVWGAGVYLDERTVDKHIASLRKKMETYQDCIRTVPGSGYEFLLPDAAKAPLVWNA